MPAVTLESVIAIAQAISQGGAVVALVVLVAYVLYRDDKREERMRSSFEKREHKFIESMDSVAKEFTSALSGNATKMGELTSLISRSLDEMRRYIDTHDRR